MNKLIFENLDLLLRLTAAGQLVIAILGPMIPRLLDWREPISRMPLLVREVFHIHTFFIALTCAIFATLTWRFAADIAFPTHELMRWLAFSIGLFWGIRSIMQWSHYSASHWRGLLGRTIAHWALFLGYGAFAITYFLAAFRR
jgi:hypothetical protein